MKRLLGAVLAALIMSGSSSIRADDPDRETAEQLQAQPGLGRAAGQPERLGKRVGNGFGGGLGLAWRVCAHGCSLRPRRCNYADPARHPHNTGYRAQCVTFSMLTSADQLAILVACLEQKLLGAQPISQQNGCWPCSRASMSRVPSSA